jgi:Domain of unknown function (DUF4055)
MPVSDRHPDYDAAAEAWRRLRDCLAGEDAVKAGRGLYLPRLGGQDDAEYDAYLRRAMFYGAAARTLDGLAGAIFRKPAVIDLAPGQEDLLEAATAGGKPLQSLARAVVREVLALGRCGLLVDMASSAAVGEAPRPAIALYAAESLVNWRVETQAGRPVTTLVVLAEQASEPGADPFALTRIDQRRVLRLVDGRYEQEIWRQGSARGTAAAGSWLLHETIQPRRLGAALDLIPFIACGPGGPGFEVERSPLLDLVNVNLSHYRTSADLEHGAHFTALPTVWVGGVGESDQFGGELRIGSGTAWLLPPGASAGILEYHGGGLSALETRLERKEKLMAVLGARLLENRLAGVEAAETVRLRHSGETSLLASVADSVGQALSDALGWAVWWRGDERQGSRIQLNKDFLDEPLSSERLNALVAAWQVGAYPASVLRWNLRRGEVIPAEMADADLDAAAP